MQSIKKQEKIKYLQEQLKVYGIISFYLNQNIIIFDYLQKLKKIYDEEYNKQWGNDIETRKTIENEIKEFFKFQNDYVIKMKQNNIEIINTLKNNWNLIDTQDMEQFEKFQLNYLRMEIEDKENQKIPGRIILAIGGYTFYDPEFSNYLTKKFQAKQNELATLQNRN